MNWSLITDLKSLWKQRKKTIKKALAVTFLLALVTVSTMTMILIDHEIYLLGLFYRSLCYPASFIITLIFNFLYMSGFIRFYLSIDSDAVKEERGNYYGSKSGVGGTAEFMGEEEQKKVFNKGSIYEIKDPIVGALGDEKEIPYNVLSIKPEIFSRGNNRNVLLIGAPGCGKTASYIIDNLLQCIRRGESAVVTDPKGELFGLVSEVARKYGYKVRLLTVNPDFLDNSDQINFLKYVRTTSEAQSFSHTLISNVVVDVNFWAEGAENLLTALTMYIVLNDDYAEKDKNIVTLYDMLTGNTVETLEEKFDTLRSVNPNHPALAPFNKFSQGDGKGVKGQTLQGLGYNLKALDDPDLRRLLSGSEQGDLDFMDLINGRCMFFIGKKDTDSSRDFVISMFYTLMIQTLTTFADKTKVRRLPIPLNIIMDEFRQGGIVPDWEQKMSTMRSRRLDVTMAIQDINQLEDMYPGNRWRTVANDCDMIILMKASNDTKTMELISTLIGKRTTTEKDISYDENVSSVFRTHGSHGAKVSHGSRDLMPINEIRTMDSDEMLVVIAGHQPIIVKKFWYFKYYPMAEELIKINASQHVPYWRLMKDPEFYNIIEEITDGHPEEFDYDNSPSILLPEAAPIEGIKAEEPDIESMRIKDRKSEKKDPVSGLLKKLALFLREKVKENTKENHRIKQPENFSNLKESETRNPFAPICSSKSNEEEGVDREDIPKAVSESNVSESNKEDIADRKKEKIPEPTPEEIPEGNVDIPENNLDDDDIIEPPEEDDEDEADIVFGNDEEFNFSPVN